jgi:hypothetical protein
MFGRRGFNASSDLNDEEAGREEPLLSAYRINQSLISHQDGPAIIQGTPLPLNP